VSFLERELARELEVKRNLCLRSDAQHGQVVDLAHARDALGSREDALAQRRLCLLGLDVDNDVAQR